MFRLLNAYLWCLLYGIAAGQEPAGSNVIFIMLDDLGRNDIGMFGAEWETPNLDSFLGDSVMLSHHYIGYVCSASRSQFLTGRYAYHNGYGTLQVFMFYTLGSVPLSTPTLMEYLTKFGGYQTIGLGKWQLGASTYEHLAHSRGFDHFWGFNSGSEDYITKSIVQEFSNDEHIDFFYNLEVSRDWDNEYSTDQYFDKMIDVIDNTANSDSVADTQSPFFIYAAIQADHSPYAQETRYYSECESKYSHVVGNDELLADRLGVCEAITGVDYQMGRLLEHFQSSDKLKSIYDNTIIIFTSDNGGDLSASSCNYPLRGGKATFFEGNQRVLAAIGGGLIPDSEKGVIKDGLISNVDWFPTILSFANLLDKDQVHASFDSSETSLAFDGYNMYNYIMGKGYSERDHVLFHISANVDDDGNLLKDIEEYELADFEEIGMIFYDDSGNLWKYFDMSQSGEVRVGSVGLNQGWCTLTTDGSNSKYTIELEETTENDDYYISVGMFDLTNDIREETNLLDNDHSTPIPTELLAIIDEKVSFYTNKNGDGSLNSGTLYSHFACLTSVPVEMQKTAIELAEKNNAWTPCLTQLEWFDMLEDECTFDAQHPIYSLLTRNVEIPSTLFDNIIDKTDRIRELNNYVSGSVDGYELQKRVYEDSNSLDQLYEKDIHRHINTSNNKFGVMFTLSMVCVALILLAAVAMVIGVQFCGWHVRYPYASSKIADINEYSPLYTT